jgi:hypothetical protein
LHHSIESVWPASCDDLNDLAQVSFIFILDAALAAFFVIVDLICFGMKSGS